ncbi:6686_t:CDS:2, partial [Dentiscutata heterogama]
EETISKTNSSSDMELSLLKSKQSQKEINLVSLEPDSQEINLVSLEPNSQESQGSSKQLPNYPVSAKQLPNYPVSSKNSNKKIPMDEFIKKLTTASSDNMYVFVNESAEEDSIEEDSIAKKLAQLFATACGSESELQRIKQIEIRDWYNYAEVFENRVSEMMANGFEDHTARTAIYDEMMPLVSGVTRKNLRQRTHNARVIFRLFSNIGLDKIQNIDYSADAISYYTIDDINMIINYVKQ